MADNVFTAFVRSLVGIMNASGDRINPATLEQLVELLARTGDETDAASASGDASVNALLKRMRDQNDERIGDWNDVYHTNNTSLRVSIPRAAQILKHDTLPTEDLLSEEIISGVYTVLYVGVAATGTLTNSPVWEIVRRVENINGTITTTILDYRSDLTWDNRADPTLNTQDAWRSDWW
jgi:hypothetical protein